MTRFADQALAILQGNRDDAINANRFSHREIVIGLHALVHGPRPTPFRRQHLRISYSDGSESIPFPLPLDPYAPLTGIDVRIPPLRLGFMSGRHPELDIVVDFYLFRHAETQRHRESADLEQEIHARACRLFQDPGFAEPWWVEAYHTGLEPVTVGFYRALTDLASQRRNQGLPVIPVVPKIWSPRDVNVNVLIRQAGGALDKHILFKALHQQAEAYPGFLSFKTGDRSPALLAWRPERPMFESELNKLCREAPVAESTFQALWHHSQYQTEKPWGL